MSRILTVPVARVGLAVVVIAAGVLVGGSVVAGVGQGPRHRTFLLQVVGGTRMSPDHIQARQGDTLSISVLTDRTEEIRLLGYERHFFPVPGQPVTLTFEADRTGTFVIEAQATGTPLGTLRIRPVKASWAWASPDRSATTVVTNEFARATGIVLTPSYDLTLEVGPLVPMTSTTAPPGWRRLELRVYDRRSGELVKNANPTITLTNSATGQAQRVPIARLQELANGPADLYYGNDVLMPSASYAVTVQVGAEAARFDVAV